MADPTTATRESLYAPIPDHPDRHCGTRNHLSIDHIEPFSRGGAHHESNFQTLCRSCNSRKGVK